MLGAVQGLGYGSSDRFLVFTALLDHAEEFLLRSATKPLTLTRCVVLHPVFEHALMRSGFFRVPSPLHWMMAPGDSPGTLPLLAQRKDWMLNGGDSDLNAV